MPVGWFEERSRETPLAGEETTRGNGELMIRSKSLLMEQPEGQTPFASIRIVARFIFG